MRSRILRLRRAGRRRSWSAAGCGGAERHQGRRRRPRRTAAAAARCRSSPTRPRRSSTTRSSPPSTRPRRAGRRLQDLLRRVRRPEPRGRGRPEGRLRVLLDRARHDAPGRRRPGRRRLGRDPDQGPDRDVDRLLRRPQGQPEEHQDLGRPAQAGRRGPDAEPVHLGRGEVEPAGRLRRQERRRQGPGGRARLPARADHRARQGPGQVRPRGAAELHLRHRRRPAVLRVRGDHRPEEGRGRSSTSSRTTRSRSRPSRPSPRTRRRRPRRSSTYALSPEGQEKFAELGLPPGRRGRCFKANKDKFPTPKNLFTIEDLGGWDKVNAELFDPENGSVAKIEEDAGVSTAQ